jgi:hypothetical protein
MRIVPNALQKMAGQKRLWPFFFRSVAPNSRGRKASGGYTYYNSCPGGRFDLSRTFNIKGPNATPDEQKSMKDQCLADMEADEEAANEEAEAERRVAAERAEAKRESEQKAAYLDAQARAATAQAAATFQLRKTSTISAVHITPKSFKCWEDFTP